MHCWLAIRSVYGSHLWRCAKLCALSAKLEIAVWHRQRRYRRQGFKCVAKRLRLRDFEEIAFLIIAFVLRDLDHTRDCTCTNVTRPELAKEQTARLDRVIRGHHLYKRVWSLRIGEQQITTVTYGTQQTVILITREVAPACLCMHVLV